MQGSDDSLVSIIIPVYNTRQYVEKCLDSLLLQTYGNWEALCIDDGSADGSGEVLDAYAAKDARFRVFHQPNQGVAIARNKALQEARGAYLLFLDSDDWYVPTAVRQYVELLETTGADLVCASALRCFADGSSRLVGFFKNSPSGLHPIAPETLKYVYICGWGKLFRRHIITEHALSFVRNLKIGEDVLFGYQYLCHCRSIAFIAEPLYCNFDSETSVTRASRKGDMAEEYYAGNLCVPLRASDYMQTVVKNRRMRDAFNTYFADAMAPKLAWVRCIKDTALRCKMIQLGRRNRRRIRLRLSLPVLLRLSVKTIYHCAKAFAVKKLRVVTGRR